MKILIAAFLLLISACDKGDNGSWSSVSQPATDDTTTSTDSGSTSGTTNGGDAGTEDLTMTDEFMELINDHRISIGLLPLIHNDSMGLIAQGHSEDMANGSVAFGHDGFSGRCSEARSALGGGNLCAENVAMGQKTVQAAFTAWMNSPGHGPILSNPEQPIPGLDIRRVAVGPITGPRYS